MLNAQNAHSEDDFSGNARPVPGRYHAAVNHAEEKGSKKKGTPGLECEFQVICDGLSPDGETPTSGQSGRTIPVFLLSTAHDDPDPKQRVHNVRMTRFAYCVGLIGAGQMKEPDWQDAVGRELVIEVESQEYEDKDGNAKSGSQISFMGFWSLGNKEVANVPKDTTTPGMQQLAKAGGPLQRPTSGGVEQKALTTPTSAPAATRGKFSDL
jgi:hypothetical protein